MKEEHIPLVVSLPKYKHVSRIDYPYTPAFNHRKATCDSCLESKKILPDDKKQYDVYYKPSDVLLKNMHYHTHKVHNVAPLLSASKSNTRTIPNDMSKHRIYNTKGLTDHMNLYARLPAIYIEPPKLTNNKYQSYSKQKRKLRQELTVNTNNGKDVTSVSEKDNEDKRPLYIRDHAPLQQIKETLETDNTTESKIFVNKKIEHLPNPLELSPDGDRVDFQIQGHEGPTTYIFGFDKEKQTIQARRETQRWNDKRLLWLL